MTQQWTYRGTIFDTAPDTAQGFVYLITNLKTKRKYIGKKNFWTVKKLPPLKGKTRKRHKRTPTDWQSYWGSSTELQNDIYSTGIEHFSREILYICNNKTQMSYYETLEQFNRGVLLSDEYYNGIIACRITAKGLK